MKKLFGLLVLSCLLLMTACGQSSSNSKEEQSKTLTVSAAASLTDVTKDLEEAFHKDHPNVKVNFNYGGSGALRQQIDKGAPVDVLMSANTKDVDLLKQKGKVKETYDYARNTLVLIHKKGSPIKSVNQLGDEDHLAMGEVESVPAGKYGKTYLESQKLWSKVEPKVVYAKDVREVLNYVDKGNAQLGFVYNTDLYVGKQQHKGVEKVAEAPLKKPIVYRMGRVTDTKEAKAWYNFMKSHKAQQIMKDYHFKN
ncbi:molybdate ABC transporter substrate-binding protein [Staphylococcus schleiferi]|nr:molybdate ABC transporter substrate-binding protein [Staphylococcus schleiferi]MBF1993496.1 molybdate ABC transporter substrate-binding protein [Staphylococcus schleiferi]MBF2039070.1 molybdate ABC transporter substrate-binding protein [Staphylococcus schleiferi]MBF2101046.1 molybdate ABC transporter substrate-binding protein [Staphylococcus schleiferi]MBF2103271.1 molybdate ABC transporter substrate-binding protein [Staphylococcus schleiferi]MBF2105326.1 molybdate ABC transporter substrate